MSREWLVVATGPAVHLIDAIALLAIVFGTVQVALAAVRLTFGSAIGQLRRDLWLRCARWLVAGLTFQLAADILETSISTEWDAIARVAAIAVIRTFRNYFLERDLDDVRQRQLASKATAAEADGARTTGR
jgi:uncharacterized membrane protein